ncbi:MAG: hypothetical protein ABR509_05735 [Candidatus Limnocylindria bacterium]
MLHRRIGSTVAIMVLLPLAVACSGEAPANSSRPETSRTAAATEASPETSPAGSDAGASDLEDINAATFSDPTTIDNRWSPNPPGWQYVYEGFTLEDGERFDHRLVITVTDLVKDIAGVLSVVVVETDYSDDVLVESELAFFAQDDEGNVWHLGEYRETYDETEFVGGRMFFEGHPAGARAGIMVPGEPEVGTSFSQGYAPPPFNWTDEGRVYQVDQSTTIGLGTYEDVVVIEEFNDEEPGAFQLKYYAPDIGVVFIGWRGDDPNHEEMELVEFAELDPDALEQARSDALELEARAYIYADTEPVEQRRLDE